MEDVNQGESEDVIGGESEDVDQGESEDAMGRSRTRRRSKPPELTEDSFGDAASIEFVGNLRRVTNGKIIIYKWNQDLDASPLCLYIDQNEIEGVTNMLEEFGAPKASINSGIKFDLSTITGFPGSHIELFDSGRVTVNWPKSKDKPDFKGSFLDVVNSISNNLGWSAKNIGTTANATANAQANANANSKANFRARANSNANSNSNANANAKANSNANGHANANAI